MSAHSALSRIVIAGGSGFLGVSLAHHLARQDTQVVLLSRQSPQCKGPWKHVAWDVRTVGDWKRELNGAAGLVNLAGRTVDCVKTPDHCDEVLRSRVEATRVLGAAVRAVDSPPPVWVQMSTAHIYGDPPDVWCDENSAFGYGLAPFVAKAWEDAFADAALPSQRQVVLRTSFVLGRDRGAGCGALRKLTRLARLGLGGRVGTGRQGISWIHENDLNSLFERALTDVTMEGAFIASSPQPVSQADFMRALRHAIGMPVGLPTPAWLARIGARFVFRTDPELALYGRYVRSQRLEADGFRFRFERVDDALRDLVR